MLIRLFWLASMVIGLSAFDSAAQAKIISMSPVSSSSLKAACDQHGGRSYDDGARFGCTAHDAIISCTDQACEAVVSDVIPVTGNSADYLLSLRGSSSGPAAIGALNARVTPQSGAQNSVASQVGH